MMDEKLGHSQFHGILADGIKEFIEFKRQSGSVYRGSEYALKAFDRFCTTLDNDALTPGQLAEAWVQPRKDKSKHDGGCSVRQLGQYLTATGHPKAFSLPCATGKAPRTLCVTPGPFTNETGEFVAEKRTMGRKYTYEEYGLRAFNNYCAIKGNELLSPQQLADAWRQNNVGGYGIATVREFGLYLTMHGSTKSFAIPYANGDMPKPPFAGYTSLFAKEIEGLLEAKRAVGIKYRGEKFRLRDFDKFCTEQSNLQLTSQELADSFLYSCEADSCSSKRARNISAIRAFGNYLTEIGSTNAFTIPIKDIVVGPYAAEILAFIAFKKSSGLKYVHSGYYLGKYDAFCAMKENELLGPQQMAEKWILKKGDEHPNTRSHRVGPVRVFGKYLASIGHPKAFSIADDAAQGGSIKPPYLFSEDDINAFFTVCAGMKPDEKDTSSHLVLPAAFLFMHCMGFRTGELKILMDDINFETGEVRIVDAKTGTRIIYMSMELSEILCKYSTTVEKTFPRRKYLFPESESRPRNDFAEHFRIIWSANVPADKHGEPRLYDLRHHFLYRNVELCIRRGENVNVLRSYIMRHMGHHLPASFQYYFHLSPPIRKEITRIKQNLDWMIPDVQEVPYE